MDRAWISILAGVGGYSVSLLSLWIGYQLFLLSAQGGFTLSAGGSVGKVALESLAPGVAFGGFGMFVAVYTTRKLMGKN